MNNKHVLLFGGGLDSACYFWYLKEYLAIPFTCLHVDYGQIAAPGEFDAMVKLCQRFGVTCHSVQSDLIKSYTNKNLLMGTGDEVIVDGRNLGLVLAAMPFGNIIHLAITDNGSDHYPDCSQQFLNRLNGVFDLSFQEPPTVCAYLLQQPKQALVANLYRNVPDIFDITWTCYRSIPSLKECGTCKHCLSKAELREALGVPNGNV